MGGERGDVGSAREERRGGGRRGEVPSNLGIERTVIQRIGDRVAVEITMRHEDNPRHFGSVRIRLG